MALLELDTYTGQLNYKDILFTFVFDGSELRLIPPADKSSEIEFNWILTPIGEGTYTSASPQMESPFLTGQCSETGRTIIFITEKGANSSFIQTIIWFMSNFVFHVDSIQEQIAFLFLYPL